MNRNALRKEARLRSRLLIAAVLGGAVLSVPASIAGRQQQVRTITLPAETVEYRKSDLPGYALAVERCSLCHSADYTAYQPRSSSRAYWQATVEKMVKVFGAPVAPEQIPAIVDYLAKTYGAEAPAAD